MGVIVNDFEVVVEPPPERAATAEAPAEAQAPGPAPLRSDDVRRVIRKRAERLARVWTH